MNSTGERIQVCSNEGPCTFPKENKSQKSKITEFKNFPLQKPLDQFQPNFAQIIRKKREFLFIQIKGHAIFQREINNKLAKIH